MCYSCCTRRAPAPGRATSPVFTFEPLPEPASRPLSLRALRARRPARRVLYPDAVQKRPSVAEPCGSAHRLLLLLVAALCLQIYASEEPGCEPALPAASCPPEGQGQGGQEEGRGLLLSPPPPPPSPLLVGEEEGAAAEAMKTGEVLLLVGVSQYLSSSSSSDL